MHWGPAESRTNMIPGPRAETPLQALVKTMARQTGPWQSIKDSRRCRYPHIRSYCSWRTASHGRDPHWKSSLRNTAYEKNPHWRSFWRTVFWTVSLVEPHARVGEEHEEKGVAETKSYEHKILWPQIPFPILLHWSRGQDRKIRLKLNLRRQKGGNKFLDLSLFLIILLSYEFLNEVCFAHVSN